jgi:ATP-dependent Clp protease ATP-binding subunit ClpC
LKEKIAKLEKEIETAVISQSYKKAQWLKQKQTEIEKEISNLKQKFKIPKNERLNVTPQDVQKVLSIATWIPTSNINKDDIQKLKTLAKSLKTQIIGQDDAVDSIVKSIMKSKTWIWNPNRPLWSFLFLWPTWVWKTELVKALTKTFYEDKDALIKFDMSEYSDKTSVNKLIWSSAWYVWYEEWWLLTEKVRKKPYSVILFDEIEKWDFEVYNLLLQILEEWIITDNKWKQINFKNTIIIMTSNIGSEEFNQKAISIWFNVSEEKENQILKDYSKQKEKIKNSLTNFFLPEFINRIDKVIIFNPLDKIQIKKIVLLQLTDLETRLNQKNITIKYDTKILNYITKTVYNPEYWAREIRRYINDYIEDVIAEKLINFQNKKSFELYIENNQLKIK